MKKIFQMHLTEKKLKSIEIYSADFVKDYRKCKGRFYVYNTVGGTGTTTTGGRSIYVCKSDNRNSFWVVSLENGTFQDEITGLLDEGLFEI